MYTPDGAQGPGEGLGRKYSYAYGFHIFRFKKDAVKAAKFFNEQLRKVRYRGAHTLGNSDGMYAGEHIVADEMMVLTKKESK